MKLEIVEADKQELQIVLDGITDFFYDLSQVIDDLKKIKYDKNLIKKIEKNKAIIKDKRVIKDLKKMESLYTEFVKTSKKLESNMDWIGDTVDRLSWS